MKNRFLNLPVFDDLVSDFVVAILSWCGKAFLGHHGQLFIVGFYGQLEEDSLPDRHADWKVFS